MDSFFVRNIPGHFQDLISESKHYRAMISRIDFQPDRPPSWTWCFQLRKMPQLMTRKWLTGHCFYEIIGRIWEIKWEELSVNYRAEICYLII